MSVESADTSVDIAGTSVDSVDSVESSAQSAGHGSHHCRHVCRIGGGSIRANSRLAPAGPFRSGALRRDDAAGGVGGTGRHGQDRDDPFARARRTAASDQLAFIANGADRREEMQRLVELHRDVKKVLAPTVSATAR